MYWDIVGLLQGSKRPLLENPGKESEKGFAGALGPGVKKLEKESKNDYFASFFRVFGLFSTLFRTFSAPGPRGPGNLFSDSFRGFSRERPF